jgi:hypothetical protein
MRYSTMITMLFAAGLANAQAQGNQFKKGGQNAGQNAGANNGQNNGQNAGGNNGGLTLLANNVQKGSQSDGGAAAAEKGQAASAT